MVETGTKHTEDDLIERLRKWKFIHTGGAFHPPICDEAAAALAQCRADPDIEAMRQACADDCASLERQLDDKDATIAELRSGVEADGRTINQLVKNNASLRAEVERLKDEIGTQSDEDENSHPTGQGSHDARE